MQRRSKSLDLEQYKPIPTVYQLRYAILRKIRMGEDPLPDIQGREEVKKDVLRALLSGSHPYLVSEEGTGKTRLARCVARLLPPVPVIKGCPYNDDPKWPRHVLCPRCRESANPLEEFGWEIKSGESRFSRIQGNEYTNEAKLLGLKDIQAIAQGRSPSDPLVFTGTGIFRANRGILFIDELPAIRTKVQVLLHPVLEEKKAILEEYNFEHPLDLILIATGNPQGFSHVNEVPRPLLDRLELIYMDLPEWETEREIMLRERFRVRGDHFEEEEKEQILLDIPLEELERRILVPAWVVDLINGAVRHSRRCRFLDKRASIRGSIKALDHTASNLEIENRNVANLRDALIGLKLSLRGRVGLRADLVDFENPRETLRKTDEVIEDLLWNAIEDYDLPLEVDKERFRHEAVSLLSEGLDGISHRIKKFKELSRLVEVLRNLQESKTDGGGEWKELLKSRPEGVLDELFYSALETVMNVAIHRRWIDSALLEGRIFIPKQVRALS